jgi:hypothetical protein
MRTKCATQENAGTNTGVMSPAKDIAGKIKSNMAITTRTVAKGVPPRVHEPKKPRAKKANTATGKPSRKPGHKRRVSQLETDEEETSSDDSEPKRKNKQNSKRRQTEESEAEEELVEEDVDGLDKGVENVDDPGGESVPDADEVSKDHLSREILTIPKSRTMA